MHVVSWRFWAIFSFPIQTKTVLQLTLLNSQEYIITFDQLYLWIWIHSLSLWPVSDYSYSDLHLRCLLCGKKCMFQMEIFKYHDIKVAQQYICIYFLLKQILSEAVLGKSLLSQNFQINWKLQSSWELGIYSLDWILYKKR